MMTVDQQPGPVTKAEVCSYTAYAFNEYDRRNELMVSFKTCQWGCCWKFQPDPCCTPPVGLIVGSVLGGFFCLCLLVVICCCCCCSIRRRERAVRVGRGGAVVGYSHHHHPGGGGGAVRFSTSSAMNDPAITTSLPPGVYQPPPSYEEVMAGEINATYKPDTYPSPPPSASPQGRGDGDSTAPDTTSQTQ